MEELGNKLLGISLIAQEKLQAIICSIPGNKNLIIENELIKPLEHVCSASWLKLKGIQKIFKFDTQHVLQHDHEQVLVFMISSRLNVFKTTLEYVERTQKSNNEQERPTELSDIKKFHIICVPNCYSYYSTLLEAHGLYGTVQLHRFNWDFITIDKRVLCLEVPYVYPTVFLNGDTSPLTAIAHSLRVLQLVCGRPELLITLGTHAANIARMLKTLNIQNKLSDPNTNDRSGQKFDIMLIIDRDKDYASSLLTPAIYAGLLLEVFDYAAGEVNIASDTNKILRQKLQLFLIEKSKDKQEDSNSTMKNLKIKLSSINDEIYGDLCHKPFTQALNQIRSQAKAIGIEVQKLNDMKLEEMHEYVARKLPKITELKAKIMRHLNACEKIIEMLANNFQRIRSLEEDILNNVSRKRILQEIDELLTSDAQKYNTLRLLCLAHLSFGLDSAEINSLFMRNYCNYFGSKEIEAFQALARAGLLPELQAEKQKRGSTTKLLSNLPLPKFQQTAFQANSNRLRLMASVSSSDMLNESQLSVASSTSSNTSNENSLTCPSYVFNSLYIPLMAQLCALIVKCSNAEDFGTKFNMLSDLEILVPDAPTTTFNPKSYANAVKQNELRNIFPLRSKNIFVYMIGGVTYAEIAACNQIERLTGAKIYVASDTIIAGSDLIASAF